MAWTQFWDMHSGGKQKLQWAQIFVELPQDEAVAWFESRFGRSPDHVTCSCCGADYSVNESPTVEEATAYHRGCAFIYPRGVPAGLRRQAGVEGARAAVARRGRRKRRASPRRLGGPRLLRQPQVAASERLRKTPRHASSSRQLPQQS